MSTTRYKRVSLALSDDLTVDEISSFAAAAQDYVGGNGRVGVARSDEGVHLVAEAVDSE